MEVELIDVMGTDESIVQAARVSYGSGTKTPSNDTALIRYLMRHKHTTPFEMVEFKFRIKCPIFVARQHMRHRTASINEISARYSIIDDHYYTPGPFRKQSTENKQGSSGELDDATNHDITERYTIWCEQAFELYNYMLERGVSRELARCILPQSTMTHFYWKINLHNLFHYLKLRTDPHAQWEIQELARMIYSIVKEKVPIATQAFEDYCTDTVTLTRPELTGTIKEGSREYTELQQKIESVKKCPYI